MCSLLVHFWEDPNDEDVWRQSRQTPAALRLQTSRSSKVQNPVGRRHTPNTSHVTFADLASANSLRLIEQPRSSAFHRRLCLIPSIRFDLPAS